MDLRVGGREKGVNGFIVGGKEGREGIGEVNGLKREQGKEEKIGYMCL